MLLRQLQEKQRQAPGAHSVLPMPHQPKQQHKRAATPPPQQQQWATLLIALILLQHVDIFLCRHIPAASKRLARGSAAAAADAAAAVRNEEPADRKRSIRSGQLEEIFNVGDRIDENYDEYPMIVPKRAALLLDRLMVALHHALEKERRKISDFYEGNSYNNNNNNNNSKNGKHKPALKSIHANADTDDELEQNNANHMYSNDDPTVIMDYDFKDLNSINRATGETLMAKSFQRRANMGLDLGGDVGAEGVAMLTAAAAAADDVSGINGGGVAGDGVGGGGRSGSGNGGRMYWRCYFNAVSCF